MILSVQQMMLSLWARCFPPSLVDVSLSLLLAGMPRPFAILLGCLRMLIFLSKHRSELREYEREQASEMEIERGTPTLCSAQFRNAHESMQALLACSAPTRQAILRLN